MLPVSQMDYHPTSEKLVQLLCSRTQNTEPLFFRVLVGYTWAVAAAQMRCIIATPDRGDIPVNLYAINLSPSGTGKGFSTSIIEDEVMSQFRERFLEETFPVMAERNLPQIAHKRAVRKQTDPDEELVRVTKEFESLGNLLFSFDSGTSPAVKQMRHKLLMANAGSVNLEIDEIGSNMMGNAEVLTTFLELYDKGKVKTKLVKSTSDSHRHEEIRGMTPTNMMLFGTPSKLFDGSVTEQHLMEMLETGYARRCLFGYLKKASKDLTVTAQEVFDVMTNTTNNQFLSDLADKLEALANIINANKKLVMSKATALLMIEYKLQCERDAEELGEHHELKKAELSHRYFKALKLAGAYAFVDDSPELTEAHLYNAIKLVEDSGEAFNRMLARDRPYVKLAKYLANIGMEVTQADLVEDLPFYKGPASQKQEMLTLAIAYGYKNNIIIKKAFNDGIEFLRGESLKETDLDKMIVSYSGDITVGFNNDYAPFEHMTKLTQNQGLHWVAHHLKDGYRNTDNYIPGFNMVVIDVDGEVSLNTAKLLLKDYKALYYTTKRHQVAEGTKPATDRFRIILPTNFELKLDAKDYKEFMSNLFEWLPFKVDESTGQVSRKWLSHNGHCEYTDGQLLDVLPFIPKTSKNEDRKNQMNTLHSMDSLERWVMTNTGDGNRNNQLLRYAYIMVDTGHDYETIRQRVLNLNDKLADKLDEMEIMNSIMVTVGKALVKKAQATTQP